MLGPLLWGLMLLLLLRYDHAKDSTVSGASWLPLIWMLIIGSRLPSQWLGLTDSSAATAFEEGSSLDRLIYLALIVLALLTLARRTLDWRDVFARNVALAAFLTFALASVIWSDYPFVTAKRWIRDLGTYLMVLVVLSERRPIEAISIVLRRLSYAVLILSVVLIKYFPYMGVLYDPWTGRPDYVGATTSKNMLGAVCMISGLYYLWDTMRRWPDRRTRASKIVLLVNLWVMVITLWLLNLSSSATSRACLGVGAAVIALVHCRWGRRSPRRVTVAVPLVIGLYFLLDLTLDFSSIAAQLLGRDPTLTGRTGMWNALLELQTNPLLGVGYQSFWLGGRLTAILSRMGVAFLNEAHNGYLETYLSLGVAGLIFLSLFMFSSYRIVCGRLNTHPHLGSFGMALWAVMIFYNVTEAAFAASLLWSVWLLFAIDMPSQSTPGGAPTLTKGRLPLVAVRHSHARDRRS